MNEWTDRYGNRVSHPFMREDGTVDVAAFCRHLDDRANAGASTIGNPIPEPKGTER